MRVLIAEDDEELAGTLAVGLRRENMAVDVALDGTSAAEKVTLTPYDVLVLDRDLPGVHGDEVLPGKWSPAGHRPGSSC